MNSSNMQFDANPVLIKGLRSSEQKNINALNRGQGGLQDHR